MSRDEQVSEDRMETQLCTVVDTRFELIRLREELDSLRLSTREGFSVKEAVRLSGLQNAIAYQDDLLLEIIVEGLIPPFTPVIFEYEGYTWRIKHNTKCWDIREIEKEEV